MAFEDRKILIVEDDPSVSEPLVNILTTEGYLVLQAEDGKKGLEIALREHPVVILLDILLPFLDGLGVLKKLREDAWGQSAPVILFTNIGTDDTILKEAVKYQPSYYLIKSELEIQEVAAKIKELIGG